VGLLRFDGGADNADEVFGGFAGVVVTLLAFPFEAALLPDACPAAGLSLPAGTGGFGWELDALELGFASEGSVCD